MENRECGGESCGSCALPSAQGSTGFALFQALSLEFWPPSSWAGAGSSLGQRVLHSPPGTSQQLDREVLG